MKWPQHVPLRLVQILILASNINLHSPLVVDTISAYSFDDDDSINLDLTLDKVNKDKVDKVDKVDKMDELDKVDKMDKDKVDKVDRVDKVRAQIVLHH